MFFKKNFFRDFIDPYISLVFQRYDSIELNFGSVLRARKSYLKNRYSIFARKTFQNCKHLNSVPKLHIQYDIKMIVILEDFPEFIAETLNSFFSKLVNNEIRLYITQPTRYYSLFFFLSDR